MGRFLRQHDKSVEKRKLFYLFCVDEIGLFEREK